MNRAECFEQIGKDTGKPSLYARREIYVDAAIVPANGCFCLFVLQHFGDPLCLDIPLRQLSFDLSDLAMLFSVCFSNSLAPTKMNLLV